MTKFKLPFVAITVMAGAVLTPALLNASDPVPTMDSKTTDLKKDNPQQPFRPKAPSHVSIHIVFNPLTQECLFGLPDGIDHVSVEVICEQTGFTFYDEVFASDPIAIIPMAPGNNVIVCTTDNGETFSGTLYI